MREKNMPTCRVGFYFDLALRKERVADSSLQIVLNFPYQPSLLAKAALSSPISAVKPKP
jgi:hypothetical protein